MEQLAKGVLDEAARLVTGPRRLNMADWKITAEWADERRLTAFFAEDGDDKHPDRSASLACAATDSSNPHQYDTTALERRETRIYLKRGAFETEAEISSAICHEMLHSLFWPIAPPDSDPLRSILLEQVINTVEAALMEGDTP